MRVNIFEAKSRLSQLIRSAQAGEDVVIAIRGKPVARLVAIDRRPKGTARAGRTRDFLLWLAEHPLPPHAQRSAEEIDGPIATERDAWD